MLPIGPQERRFALQWPGKPSMNSCLDGRFIQGVQANLRRHPQQKRLAVLENREGQFIAHRGRIGHDQGIHRQQGQHLSQVQPFVGGSLADPPAPQQPRSEVDEGRHPGGRGRRLAASFAHVGFQFGRTRAFDSRPVTAHRHQAVDREPLGITPLNFFADALARARAAVPASEPMPFGTLPASCRDVFGLRGTPRKTHVPPRTAQTRNRRQPKSLPANQHQRLEVPSRLRVREVRAGFRFSRRAACGNIGPWPDYCGSSTPAQLIT